MAELERLPPDTELLSASFPCVDVSRAGGRAGIDGAATGLVRHVFRLLGDAAGPRVPWVLLENVPGLLDRTADGPPAVAFVVDELERLGYSWAQRVLSSAAFGIPQRRRRVFIVASLHGDPRDVLLAQNYACLGGCTAAFGAPCSECAMQVPPAPATQEEAEPPAQREAGSGSGDEPAGHDSAPGANASALSTFADGGAQHGIAVDLSNAQNAPVVGLLPTMTTGNCRMAVLLPCGSFGLLRIQDAERLQGMPPDWTEPGAVLASRGVSQSREGAERRYDVALRWGLVGNAVCVPVARWLGERLRAPYSYKYVPRGCARPFNARLPDTWPRVAWRVVGVAGGRHRAEASEAPLYAPFAPIGDFVRAVGPPPSVEAVAVWAGRMRSAGWTIAGPLRASMDALLASAPRALHPQLAESAGVPALPALPPAPPPPPDAEALERSVFLREPRARRMVWAKYAAFPWWPGLVADLEGDHVPERTLRAPGRGANSLLVVFFGDGTWQWVRPDCVVDFAPHFGEHAGAPVGRSRALFLAAVAEAKEMCDAREGRAAGALPPAADAGQTAAAMQLMGTPQPGAAFAALAPAAALVSGATDASKRCGDCRACKTASHRVCLLADARRLAAAGHAGAALTVAGASACGTRVEIFWPLDERYYSGTLFGFDAYTCAHKILYDDDETETAALWKETVACQGVAPRPMARDRGCALPPAGGDAVPASADGDGAGANTAAAAEVSDDEGNWDHLHAQNAAAAAPSATPPVRVQETTPVASPVIPTPDVAGGATTALSPELLGRARSRTLPARLQEPPPIAPRKRAAPRPQPPKPAADTPPAQERLPLAGAVSPSPTAEALPVKRRRGEAIDYAALLATPRERPGSARCAACKTQKKGTCGTPTASRLCLNRTPDMPLRREPNRRGGLGALFMPYRPPSGTLPVLPPDLPPVLTMPHWAGASGSTAAAPPASALLLPGPSAPVAHAPAQLLALAGLQPSSAPRAHSGSASADTEQPTSVPWTRITGYTPP